VNPAAQGITADEAEKPKNYQDDSDRPKHKKRAPKYRGQGRTARESRRQYRSVRYGKVPGIEARLSYAWENL